MRWERKNLFLFKTKPMVYGMLMCLTVFFVSPAMGEEKKKNLPARGISLSPEYTGIVIAEGESASIDLNLTNRGRRDENINLSLSPVPKGWNAWVKTYSYAITGVFVRSDKSKSLTLRVEPDADIGPGEYTFGIMAKTDDSKLKSTGRVTVTVKGKKEVKKKKGINIITSYPVLRGPTDGKFGFSLEIENKLDKDSLFNLAVQGPENWDINFKPAYEEKLISSLRLKAGQSQTVAVDVKPFPWEKPGQYPILVKVSSPEAKGEASLSVILTGTYKLDAGTANGLLSLEALRGKPNNLSFYVKNSGSAVLNNIQFLSFKPENWEVEFIPEKAETLAPGEVKQVEVSITPTDEALVGDYSVGISAEAGKVSKTIEFRVTVKASTAWGWIGIGIILLVVVGLVALFIRLGRR
jgi:uncharacterized membrane protein